MNRLHRIVAGLTTAGLYNESREVLAMFPRKEISRRTYKKHGYYVATEDVDDGNGGFEMRSAYTLADEYIGNPKDAYRICVKLGIRPEKADPECRLL